MPCGYVTNNGTVTITKYTGPGGTVIIPGTIDGLPVTRIQPSAFADCPSLTAAYFQGNAPSADWLYFSDENTVVYYLPKTTGWESTFGGRPTELWKPQVQTIDASFGIRTNRFGFNVTWANGMVVAMETCTNLANPIWIPLQTNTLSGGGSYFSDPQWKAYPGRFYRLRAL
jgi:hypothetical protein